MGKVEQRLYRSSAGHAPARMPGSVRRTSTIDVWWTGERGTPGQFLGRARDAFTPEAGGSPQVLAEDSFTAVLQQDRTILAIESDPVRPAMAALVGRRAGSGFRQFLSETMPDELKCATPLYLLLDDIPGSSLVSGWAWSQWMPNWLDVLRDPVKLAELEKGFPSRIGICAGFAPGSSGLSPAKDHSGTPAPDLRNPADLEGWHPYREEPGIGMRRARRIDVWRDDGVIRVDSAFQDSASTPAGGRAVVHEYSLRLKADSGALAITAIDAQPHVLPFVECPNAAANAAGLVGTALPELRQTVLERLRGTAGCTHLNDALRALADVPALLDFLPSASQ